MQSRDYSEVILQVVFYVCSVYFFLMGSLLIIAPEIATRTAGEQNPLVLGMLRGAGGGIIPYSLLYVYVARKPVERMWGTWVIGLANTLAIAVDLTSVYLGEYALAHAMMDLPVEALSLIAIAVFRLRSSRS